jgi:hypothetical protein
MYQFITINAIKQIKVANYKLGRNAALQGNNAFIGIPNRN